MDMPAAGEEPMKGSKPPDLRMSPELQQRLDHWRLTGDSPLVELRSRDPLYWTRFSTLDLRLIHHIVTLSSDMQARGYSQCTPWASKMPSLIAVALSHDFVMSALLAMSAYHLAWQTQNVDTKNLAYHHQGVALKGLHEAIGAFSRDNSDAILAASMLLSWQAAEWRPWASLQQGVSTVMNAMRPWAHESDLAQYLNFQRSMARGMTSSTPAYPTPTIPMSNENLRRVEEMMGELHNLKVRLANNEELAEHVGRLLEYLRQLQQSFPIPAPEQAFIRLQPLRELIFWLPPLILRAGEYDLGPFTVLAHLYATALILEPLFPEIGGAYFGEMCLAPLEKIHDILRTRRNSQPQASDFQVALSLVEVPMQMATMYRSRQGPMFTTSPDGYRSSPHASPYMAPHMQMGSSGEPGAAIYAQSPHPAPGSISMQGGSYFPSPTADSAARRDSSSLRTQSMSERILNTGGGSYPLPVANGGQRVSMDAGAARPDYYYPQTQVPYQYHGAVGMNTRFVTPSQLWEATAVPADLVRGLFVHQLFPGVVSDISMRRDIINGPLQQDNQFGGDLQGVFTSLIEQLGVQDVQFEELISLDADAIRTLSPVYGVIFLFKWIGGSEADKSRPQDGTFDGDAVDDAGLFFAAQTIQNACGTQAILSVILNNDRASDPSAGIDIGPALRDFKAFTAGFPTDLRGEALSNSDLIRDTHNSFAKASPFADETQKDAEAASEDVFHFIAYTVHHGKLYELDGLQPFPISHGDCTADEFPDKIIPVLQRRIERYPPGEIHFNLMAVCRDLRIKAREFHDAEGLASERRKRAHWDWENALRRHNFVGFTGEVLRGVVGVKLQDGNYDKWITDAEEATKKRLQDRSAKKTGGQPTTA
ncbi:hypothetical protein DV738_g5155, partial [Chaetothyriales sp. CBS 135597]